MTQHLLTEPAKMVVCTRCDSPVITAITGGLTTVVNPRPITIDQEIAALLTGQATFDLHAIGKTVYLEWRDLTRIRAGRAHPVVVIHRCGPGAQLLPLVFTPAAGEVPDEPPF